jgi:hypothetical protein
VRQACDEGRCTLLEKDTFHLGTGYLYRLQPAPGEGKAAGRSV